MKIKSVLIFLLIVFLSGCSHVANTDNLDLDSNNGLSVAIVENSLSDTYYEGENVNIDLIVENKGDYQVEKNNLNLYLSGFNPTAFGKTVEDLKLFNQNNLSAIFINQNESLITGVEYFTFENLCYKNDLENPYALNLKFIACYPYETVISSKVCFGDPISSNNGVCTVNEPKSYSNSLGPIQGTSLVENYIGNGDYRFVMNFINNGNGDVISPDKTGDCTNIDSRSTSLMSIKSIKLDGEELIDSEILNLELPQNKDNLRIINNEGSISFKINQPLDIDYVGDLQITLSHGYKTSFDEITTIYDTEGVQGCEL